MTLLLLNLFACTPAPDLPVLADAPSFALTDEQGQTVDNDTLRGRVWVADFIFTRCPHACPMLTQKLTQVAEGTQDSSGAPVELVSFTVDPAYDTPEVLKDFAGLYPIPLDRWHLLTGELPAMEAVSAGFMQGLERASEQPVPDIRHSQRLLLVDPQGRLRGMYRTDEEALDELIRAAQHLAKHPES